MSRLRRRLAALLTLGGGKGLPAGYTRVDAITASNQPYIDTDYVPVGDETIEVSFRVETAPASNNHVVLFGTREGANTTSPTNCWLGLHGGGNVVLRAGTANFGTTLGWQVDVDYVATADLAACAFDMNGEARSFAGSVVEGIVRSLYINNISGTGVTRSGRCSYKGFRITRAGTVVVDMVAARNDSTDELGMYDLARHRFFANAGSGSFA